MRLFLGAATLTAFVLVSARPGRAPLDTSRSSGQQQRQLPSVTLPPALDRVLRDYEKGWRAADAASLAMLFTDDGFVLQPGHPPVRGRDAIRAAYSASGGGPLRLRPLAYAIEGDVGFIIGAYGYGDQPGDVGKFTLTLRRGAGDRWLIMSDMDNGNTRQ